MKTRKNIKILSFICAMIILFTTVCPNVALAANEIKNIVSNETSITNEENIKTKENTIVNEMQNNILEKRTNETVIEENNITENTLNISNSKDTDKTQNEEKTEIKKEQNVEKEEKIKVVENEEEYIKMQQVKEIELSESNMENISLYSTQDTNLYVIQLASYILTTKNNRGDGYGVLIRKIATTSNYSDVKQAFCIELRRRFRFWSSQWLYNR